MPSCKRTKNKSKNKELQEFYNTPNTKGKLLEWFIHVRRSGGLEVKKVLINKINIKRPLKILGIPRT